MEAAATDDAACVECTSPRQPSGAWGRCAIVGLGESLLDHKFGAEIDAHDTVIRIGYAPTTEYAAWAGSRTDVVLARMNSRNKDCSLDHDVWQLHDDKGVTKKLKGYILFAEHGKPRFQVPASLTVSKHGCKPSRNTHFGGVPITWLRAPSLGTMQFRDNFFDHLTKTYAEQPDAEERKKGYKPTSGFYLVWGVLASQLCKSVDIYGFGENGFGTHYFAHTMTGTGNAHVPKNIVHKDGFPTADQW